MLALTRKKEEAIIIDGNIEIRILEIQGDKVKIGISAPKEVKIHREEVYISIQESNKAAIYEGATSLKNLGDLLNNKIKN